MYAHAYHSLFYVLLIRCLEMFFLYLENMFINIRFIIDPALILYCGFEHAAWQVVGTHWKYLLVGGKGRSTKERIHDGKTWERERSSLRFSRGQGTRRGNEIEGL